MKVKIITLVLSILFAMPVFLCAEEMEIPLMEVVGMEVIEGDNPLDNPDKEGDTPTRPGNFRATISTLPIGNYYICIKQGEKFHTNLIIKE